MGRLIRKRIAKLEGRRKVRKREEGIMAFTYEPDRVFHFGKAHDQKSVQAAAAEARAMLEAQGIKVHPKAKAYMRPFHSHEECEAWGMRQQAELIADAD